METTLSTIISSTEPPKFNFSEYRKEWVALNKEKLAGYARKQYLKQVEENPEYRKVLVERTLERRKRLREGQPPKTMGRPKKEPPTEEVIKNPPGRPRKYM
jgi:hypothetical protein